MRPRTAMTARTKTTVHAPSPSLVVFTLKRVTDKSKTASNLKQNKTIALI